MYLRIHILSCIILLLSIQTYSVCAQKCLSISSGIPIDGKLTSTHPTQCYIVSKPPLTREIFKIDLATYDTREGYYICISADGGVNGTGCVAPLRSSNTALCLDPIDTKDFIHVNVTCALADPLGCHFLDDGRYRLIVSWVFTDKSCSNIQDHPSSAPYLSSFSLFFVFTTLIVILI